MTSQHNSRNYAIDLLKILSMAMVLGLHTNRYGGFLEISEPTWYKFMIYYYEHLCIVAVNVFVIISAWFLREKMSSTKKVLTMLMAILFWTVVSLVVAHYLGQEVGKKWLYSSIPFFGRAYDFLSGYIIMYMLVPVLNNMLNNSTNKQKALLAIGSFVVFSLCAPLTTSHYLRIGSGYSFIWFICLYVMTAYIKDNRIRYKKELAFPLFLVLAFVATIADIWGGHFSHILSSLAYNNFIVVICSFSIFLFFQDININRTSTIKVVTFLSPMTLGVFLIHDHNLMEQYYETLNICSLFEGCEVLYVFCFPFFLIVAYLFCSVLEYMRIKLFELLKVPLLISRLSCKIDGGIDKYFK